MRRSRLTRLIQHGLLLTGALCLTFATILFFQCYKYWAILTSNSAGWIGRVHKSDERLGYVPIPKSFGAMVLPDGTTIPVFYDSLGFRTNSEKITEPFPNSTKRSNSILGLGCSFMFGFGVQARSTFCSLTAQSLGMIPLNAGRCSYGLAEMAILARQLITEIKPEIVLVQYSTWLIERSQQRYGSTFCGLLPHPYFVDESGPVLGIHKPDFESMIFSRGFAAFRTSSSSQWALLNFAINFGFPLVFHDLWNAGLVQLRESLKLVPEPSKRTEDIVDSVYREIASICSHSGCKMYIVVLGANNETPDIPESLTKLDSGIINAQLELTDRLESNTNYEYEKSYYHWGGTPRRVIDKHPNTSAHKIIAEGITKVVREFRNGSGK